MSHYSVPNSDFWHGKRVFLTGHTGFKGSWMALWLHSLGAIVTGYALAPPTQPALFDVLHLADDITSITADIRDLGQLTAALQGSEAEIVIHMAAQPLVRASYLDPVANYMTNVMGVVHVLEAVRKTSSVKVVLNITTDKCYENKEWLWPYREDEALGGHDPYSNSKACAELVTASYRQSFLADAGVAVATARAGNVIGGGDWAQDRLIPDSLRALDAQLPLIIRSPHAIRPWQHVLEPICGYLLLAEKLYANGAEFAHAWNFGASMDDAHSVEHILNYLKTQLPSFSWRLDDAPQPHEANFLTLDSSKARHHLNWHARYDLYAALDTTIAWHSAWRQGGDMRAFTVQQIEDYRHAT